MSISKKLNFCYTFVICLLFKWPVFMSSLVRYICTYIVCTAKVFVMYKVCSWGKLPCCVPHRTYVRSISWLCSTYVLHWHFSTDRKMIGIEASEDDIQTNQNTTYKVSLRSFMYKHNGVIFFDKIAFSMQCRFYEEYW